VADQEDRQAVKKVNPVIEAINTIAETEAGVVFFTWLKNRCFFQTSTVVGDPQSHEINVYGTLYNEAARRLYLDIRRDMRPKLREKIEQ
jgi:hypothetical protein